MPEDVVLTHVWVGWVPCMCLYATLPHLQEPERMPAAFLPGHVETWGMEEFFFSFNVF